MKNKKKLIILTILFTTNNILYALTDLNGKVIFWTSIGSKKTKGIKKTVSTSILAVTKNISNYIQKIGYKNLYIKIKGFNKSKKLVIKYLNQSFLNILLISDETSFPHNGCKKVKNRRV
uniref:Ribosomal protein S11 n=1 Tax=Riquetophycus sp. HSY-2014a TaxID=1488470 RepID=A0A0E3DBS7_9FLOR|nr:ribosomal protein S11 [Riquetophycus sp. HSY-2014a]